VVPVGVVPSGIDRPPDGVSAVGHNPEPRPSVRGIDGTSRNFNRDCLVVESFQIRKHSVEAHELVVIKARHIFPNDPFRPASGNKSAHFRPEVAVIFRASSLPGNGPRLAGESAANNVDRSELIAFHFPDIRHAPYIRPMLRQYRKAEWVNFNLAGAFHTGAFKAQIETADTRE
jgi:hypothetical protein